MSNPYKIVITIADILIEVKSPISAIKLGIGNRLSSFLCMLKNPIAHVSITWHESEDTPAPKGELVYDPGSILKMYRLGSEFYAAICYPSGNETTKEQAVLHANSTWDNLILTEQPTGATWQSLINIGASELLLRTKIILMDGLVFHASGIDDNGRGVVFVGHSGAGKSTQVGLWNQLTGVIVMNDDRIAVRVKTNSAICYATPWGGTANIAHNHQAPLSALILLEQAKKNKIQQLAPSIAAPLLLARTFLPYWDCAFMQRALTNMNKLLACIPVYLLQCRPEPEVISLVRSVL